MAWRIIVLIAAGYLLGNLNGAILTSRLFHQEDVRDKGSGNAGLTNFFRNYGGLDTLIVILVDAGKAVLACYLGFWLFRDFDPSFVHTAEMICGGMTVVGHMFPVFWSLRGGKGILTSGGVALYFGIHYGIWWIIVICLGLFILVVLLTRYVSLGSILGMLLLPVTFWIFLPGEPWACAIAAVMTVLAIVLHRGNIARLCKGTERKFTFKRQ